MIKLDDAAFLDTFDDAMSLSDRVHFLHPDRPGHFYILEKRSAPDRQDDPYDTTMSLCTAWYSFHVTPDAEFATQHLIESLASVHLHLKRLRRHGWRYHEDEDTEFDIPKHTLVAWQECRRIRARHASDGSRRWWEKTVGAVVEWANFLISCPMSRTLSNFFILLCRHVHCRSDLATPVP